MLKNFWKFTIGDRIHTYATQIFVYGGGQISSRTSSGDHSAKKFVEEISTTFVTQHDAAA